MRFLGSGRSLQPGLGASVVAIAMTAPSAVAADGFTSRRCGSRRSSDPRGISPARSSVISTRPTARRRTSLSPRSSPPTASAARRTTRRRRPAPTPSAATPCSPTRASASADRVARSPSTTPTGTAARARSSSPSSAAAAPRPTARASTTSPAIARAATARRTTTIRGSAWSAAPTAGGRLVHRSHPHPHVHPAGPVRHALQPAGVARHLPRAQGAQGAGPPVLAPLGPQRARGQG